MGVALAAAQCIYPRMRHGSRLRLTALFLSLTAAATLAACGGGGGGGGGVAVTPPAPPPPPLPPPPPPAGATTWVPGRFDAASLFKDRCEAPRSGVDIEGRAFPDRAGTLLQEKFWLRSWTNETYLWNTEVTDRDPASVAGKLDYFALLRTFALTPSGKEKDDFHFSESTEQFLRNRQSAPTASYGVRLAGLSTTRPRDYRVLFTEPNSPATQVVGGVQQFRRGTRILTVNGIDLVNGGTTPEDLAALNAGLFPTAVGTTTTFTVRDPGAAADRTVTITSAAISTKPVNRTAVIPTATGPVGYVLFNTFSPFSSERDIFEAMQAMQTAGVRDLVLDLRYNGGGLLTVASQLSFMVAGPTRTAGRFFERLRFNAAAGGLNPVTGAANNPQPFESRTVGFSVTANTPLPNLNLPRVYVLSTSRTCSASEAVVNGLRGIGVEVVLIGTTTCGKPFGFYPQDNCGTTYYTIQFQGTNDQGFGDYADGFIPNNSPAAFGVRLPGCQVPDDLSRELGDTGEALLAAALQFRATGTCPAVAAATDVAGGATGPTAGTVPLDPAAAAFEASIAITEPAEPVMTQNRDMTAPPRRP